MSTAFPLRPLCDLASSIDYGVTASASAIENGPKFLRITDIQDGNVNWHAVPFCEAPASKLKSAKLADGDIVFARTGATTGKSFLIQSPPDGAVFASYLIRVRPSASVNPAYLAHFFQSNDYWRQIQRKTQGAAQGGVNATSLSEIEIPIPTLDDQERISAILDKADELRRKRKLAADLLSRITQSIFLEIFGDPVANPLKLPTAPLGSITSKIGSGATPSGGDVAYKASGISLVRSMNVRDEGFTSKGLAYIDEHQAAKLDNVTLEVGDVLLNITGASVARVCLCPPEVLPGRVNQHVAIIRPKDKSLNVYIATALKMPAMKAKLLGVAEAGATRQAITKAQIEKIEIPLPSMDALEQFRDANSKYHELGKKVNLQSLLMNSLFSSLQHRAFSGELR